MSPDFSQRYDCSMSTSFSSKLCGNCPCILFPCHLSFVFSTMLSFIFLVSFYTSVFRHLAVCNTAESVLCWCVLTTYYYYYISEQIPQVSHMTIEYGRNHKHVILIQKSCKFARKLQGVMFKIFGIIQYLEAPLIACVLMSSDCPSVT